LCGPAAPQSFVCWPYQLARIKGRQRLAYQVHSSFSTPAEYAHGERHGPCNHRCSSARELALILLCSLSLPDTQQPHLAMLSQHTLSAALASVGGLCLHLALSPSIACIDQKCPAVAGAAGWSTGQQHSAPLCCLRMSIGTPSCKKARRSVGPAKGKPLRAIALIRFLEASAMYNPERRHISAAQITDQEKIAHGKGWRQEAPGGQRKAACAAADSHRCC